MLLDMMVVNEGITSVLTGLHKIIKILHLKGAYKE